MAAQQADSLRAVLDSVFAAPAYRWVEQPRPLRLLGEWWDALRGWLAAFEAGNPGLFRIFVIALVVVLAAIVLHATWITVRTVRGAAKGEATWRPASTPRRDRAWYRAAADRAAADGRYAAALQLAFVALALALDERGIVRFHPAKTPGDYAREAALAADDRARLRTLVTALYRHAFGGEPCGPEDYRRWCDAAAEWHAPAH
jgi:hypothetical protein